MQHDLANIEARECAIRVLAQKKGDERIALLNQLMQADTDWHGRYAMYLAHEYYTAANWDAWERTIRESRKRQDERHFSGWDFDEYAVQQWIDGARANEKLDAVLQDVVSNSDKLEQLRSSVKPKDEEKGEESDG